MLNPVQDKRQRSQTTRKQRALWDESLKAGYFAFANSAQVALNHFTDSAISGV